MGLQTQIFATKAKAGAEAKANRQNDPGCRVGTLDGDFKLGHARSPVSHGFGNADVCAAKAKAGAEAKAKRQNDPGRCLDTSDGQWKLGHWEDH